MVCRRGIWFGNDFPGTTHRSLSMAFPPLPGEHSAARRDEPDQGLAMFFSAPAPRTPLLPACQPQRSRAQSPVLTHQRRPSPVIPSNPHSAGYSGFSLFWLFSLDCCQACLFLETYSPLFHRTKNPTNKKPRRNPHQLFTEASCPSSSVSSCLRERPWGCILQNRAHLCNIV